MSLHCLFLFISVSLSLWPMLSNATTTCPSGRASKKSNIASTTELKIKECSGNGAELCAWCCSYSYISNSSASGEVTRCNAWSSSTSEACKQETPAVSEQLQITSYICNPAVVSGLGCTACEEFSPTIKVSVGNRIARTEEMVYFVPLFLVLACWLNVI